MLKREKDSHKGDNGRVIVVGGSLMFHGAPILCSLGAEYSGGDLVFPFIPKMQVEAAKAYSLNLIIQTFEEEALSNKDVKNILNFSKKADVIVIGPGIGTDGKTKTAVKSLFKHLEIPTVVDASALLYIGKANREYYEYYGACEEQLFFTPYAVDNIFFQNKSQDAAQHRPALRRDLGLIEDIPVICYASKLMKRKNPALLLDAYAGLAKNKTASSDAYLIYVGDGEERLAIEKKIDQLGLHDRVKILGFKNQTELPAYFALCDLFVLPSEQ